jgi:hypothetical protein
MCINPNTNPGLQSAGRRYVPQASDMTNMTLPRFLRRFAAAKRDAIILPLNDDVQISRPSATRYQNGEM